MKRILLLSAVVWLASPPVSAEERVKLFIEEAGVYSVSYADLVRAGVAEEGVGVSSLRLTSGGSEVPAWVHDDGDGLFNGSDAIEFVAEHLPGDVSFYHDYSQQNVYSLELGAARGARPKSPTVSGCSVSTLKAGRHLERDVIRARFPGSGEKPQEIWYWARLTFLDEPWTLNIELPDLDESSAEPVRAALHFRGWSRMHHKHRDLDDHKVEVRWNDTPVAEESWDNSESGHSIELDLSPGLLRAGANRLAIRVPRRDDENGAGLVDMVLLNSLDLTYPRRSDQFSGQDRILWDRSEACAGVPASADRALVAWAPDGSWRTTSHERRLQIPGSSGGAWIVPETDLRRPVEIALDAPSDLRAKDQQADYLMIGHRRLLSAVEPLAEFHRSRGLTVKVIDVEDVYDEFAHGVRIPQGIRSFVRYTKEEWAGPAPRFVLLVGDASWDTKNSEVDDRNYADWAYRAGFRQGEANEFRKNESTPYAEKASLNHRNLIPTWQEVTAQGHAASDHAFVAFDGTTPEMAIGRFPVTEPEEVEAIVGKSIAYASNPPVGPWKTNALFITNESERYQDRSDGLAGQVSTDGWTSTKIYPASAEASNEQHTQALVDAFNQGQHVVHFLGHGGRYIWRTGPPDFRKNHDLFTLDDIERLAANERLSIVMSLSCYSAPFDHPNADSIGEKFLRLADRGAVAVIAASWRNVPGIDYSRLLLEGVGDSVTIGEAFLSAKQQIEARPFRLQYNLLGDPALPIARPTFEITLDQPVAGKPVLVAEVSESAFEGPGVVEWLDDAGEPVLRREIPSVHGRFEISIPADVPETAKRVRLYAWNEEARTDGLGVFELPEESVTVTADGPEPASPSVTAHQGEALP